MSANKNYADFISDVADDASLGKALYDCIPFPDKAALRAWFEHREYALSDGELETLLENQEKLNLQDENAGY